MALANCNFLELLFGLMLLSPHCSGSNEASPFNSPLIYGNGRTDLPQVQLFVQPSSPVKFKSHVRSRRPSTCEFITVISSRGDHVTNVYCKEGSDVDFFCEVKNVTKATGVTWYRNNNEKVNRTMGFIQRKVHTSSVNSILTKQHLSRRKDWGAYHCVSTPGNVRGAVRLVGEDENRAQLLLTSSGSSFRVPRLCSFLPCFMIVILILVNCQF